MTARVLVTGATGFVGYHVAKKALERGLGTVRCLVRPGSDLRFLRGLGVELAEGDLRDSESLKRACRGAEVLFHVAADYRLWSKDPAELIATNVAGTRNILEAARAAGVRRTVYTSSVSAVGRPEGKDGAHSSVPGDETLDPAPSQLIGPYKISKYQAELEARRFAAEGMDLVIVNPSTPVGSHDSKPTPTGRIILDFLKGRMPAYLDTGLNLVDVADVAEGHMLALQKGRKGERYILGHRNLMLREILETLARISGRPAPRFKIPYAAAWAAGFLSTALARLTGVPPAVPLDGVRMAREIMFYSSAKAVRELGLPQSPVDGALEKAVLFYKENGYC